MPSGSIFPTLARSLLPAEIVNLTFSNVTDVPLDYITGPAVPGTSTLEGISKEL